MSLLAYAAVGTALSVAFYRSSDLRESSAAHVVALLISLLFGVLTIGVLNAEERAYDASLSRYPVGQGFLFLCASLAYIPVVVTTMIYQWNRLLVHLMSPGSTRDSSVPLRTSVEEWKLVEEHTEALRFDPLNAERRKQLAESYLKLGHTDRAIAEFQRTVECLDRGYEQAHLLYRISRLLVDEKKDVPAALPILRRMTRMYPKSYFAAFARRVINTFDAHHPRADRDPDSSRKS
ncbi:MAG: hypothetical protein AAF517_20675 [Planctomycetota bacterium]